MFRAPERLRKATKSSSSAAVSRLAAAYYLARDHGIRDIAVLENDYLGGGTYRAQYHHHPSNYLTPEGVKFYDASLALWAGLPPSLTSTCSIPRVGISRWRLGCRLANRALARGGEQAFRVSSEVVDAAFVKKLVPQIDLRLRRTLADPGALCTTSLEQ